MNEHMAEIKIGCSKAAWLRCGPKARAVSNNAAAADFNPVPSGMRSRYKFAALGKAIRHSCRKASPALRCLNLDLHHMLIHFRKWYYKT